MPVTGYADLRARLDRGGAGAPQMPFSPLALTSRHRLPGPPRPGRPTRNGALSPARTGPILLVNARHDPATAVPLGPARRRPARPACLPADLRGLGAHRLRPHRLRQRRGRPLPDHARPPAAGARCPGVEPVAAGVGGIAPRPGYR